MPILSRILWGFITLSLVALVTVAFLVPDAVINFLNMLGSIHIVARFIVVILIYGILLALLFRRVRQDNPVGDDYLIVNATGAVASITLDSVRERVQKVVENIAEVDRANVQVESINGRCAITLDVHASANVNVPEKHREIARAIEQVVKKQLGLKVARQPRVSLHLGNENLPAAPTPKSEEKEPRRFAGIFPLGQSQENEPSKPKEEKLPRPEAVFPPLPPKDEVITTKTPSDLDMSATKETKAVHDDEVISPTPEESETDTLVESDESDDDVLPKY